MSSITIAGAQSVVLFPGDGPLRGDDYRAIETLNDASVSCEGTDIASVGDARNGATTLDAAGCTVIPGFVDCHTHLPFCGWRADEDAARLSGVRYEALHQEEGGIFRSVRMLAESEDEMVLGFCASLADDMLRKGTTCLETKSGYGLTVEAELRQLRLARALGERVPQTVVSTCLAAHAVPRGKSAGEWVGEAANELLPRVAQEGLAGACDVYVESIAFALEHAARLAETCESLGFAMRVHADQLEDGQTAAMAARWGFRSADHLNHTSLDAAGDLAASDTAAVLLPGATFTLRQNKKPPARRLIEDGAIVAVGTDLNPGTSPIHSMPLAITLACRMYGLRPLEALAAATVNGAHVLGLGDRLGRIAPGYRADLVVIDAPTFDSVPYRPDHDAILAVLCGGELAYLAPQAQDRISGPS